MTRKIFYLSSIFLIGSTIALAHFFSYLYLLFFIFIVPIVAVGIYDVLQKKYTILRNFPIIGHFRYLLLEIRPEMHQYFVENNSEGTPFSYEKREVIYARAKKELATLPFGTRRDTYRVGYEWINHSLLPTKEKLSDEEVRVTIGTEKCKQPYSASIFNVSAMSFGALSKNAILCPQ